MAAAHDASAGPLAGLRVVGLEHSVAGPLCTRLLADMGADVVKVERPGSGDFARHWDRNVAGESAQFWWLNRGKRSVALDLRAADGRRAFERLLERSDVLVHNLRPSAAERLGFASADFDRRFEHLVHCQISGYGADGPLRDRKAYDMLVQAEGGIMSLTGTEEQPSRVGVSLCDVGTGIYAAALVLGAVLEQRRTGRGRRIDVAMVDTAVELLGPMLLSFANAGAIYPRIPQRHHAIAPYGLFACADGGALLLAVEQDREWRLLADRLLGDSSLADDPRFASNSARIEHRALVDDLVAAALARCSVAEAVTLLDALDVAYAVLNDVPAVHAHPVVAHREMLDATRTASGVPVEGLVGSGRRAFGAAGPLAPPPSLGQHTDEVLAALDPPGD